jgi:hypothetical protein
MLEIEKSKAFRIPEKFVLHRLGDELYWLFDVQDGDVYQLNAVSYFIISCFDGKTSLQNVLDKVELQYSSIEAQEVRRDFEELVQKLINSQILECLKEV